MSAAALPGRRSKPRRPWLVILPWVVTAAILVGTAFVAFWPREPELRSPVKPGEAGELIWGDGVFTDASQLEAWLNARGVSYKQWARRHPNAVRLLAPPPDGAARPAQPAKEAAPAQEATPPPPPPAAVSESLTSRRSLSMLALLALLGATLALAVSRFASRERRPDYRVGVLVSVASVGVGIAVASFLS